MPTLSCFRAEGVLLPRRAPACAAWMALRTRAPLGRLGRVANVLAAPLGAAAALAEPAARARLTWLALRGCSEDRLVVLAEDWWAEQRRDLNRAGLALLQRARDAGHRVVLVSDHPDVAVAPLAALVGADELVCNRLEVVDGELTGALVPPVVSGAVDGAWLRARARAHGVEPARVHAYGQAAEDATLLAGAAHPCAVTPDRGLLRLALELDWPVVEAAA